jgi:putative endonuclease
MEDNIINKATHLTVGKAGEDIVVKHLVKQQYKILDRNFRKQYGELDIIASKDGIVHFLEVKTVSSEVDFENHRPEEKIDHNKRKKMAKTIESYLAGNSVSYETEEIQEFQIHSAAVYYNPDTKETKIRITENIILD